MQVCKISHFPFAYVFFNLCKYRFYITCKGKQLQMNSSRTRKNKGKIKITCFPFVENKKDFIFEEWWINGKEHLSVSLPWSRKNGKSFAKSSYPPSSERKVNCKDVKKCFNKKVPIRVSSSRCMYNNQGEQRVVRFNPNS